MKDPSRQPTTLKRLEELIRIGEGEGITVGTDEQVLAAVERCAEESNAWLVWAFNFLSARKLAHKKHYVKRAMLEKMAKTMLSKDELEAIDREAEKQLGNLENDTIEPTLEEEPEHELND